MTNIRLLQPEDLPAVCRLIQQLADTVGVPRSMTLDQVSNLFSRMNLQPEIYATYVAENEQGVIGLISLICYKVWFHPGGTALINELIVDEAYRGKGIGKRLIAAAIEAARAHGMDEIEVGTEQENLGAQKFYKRCGFDEEYVLLGKIFE